MYHSQKTWQTFLSYTAMDIIMNVSVKVRREVRKLKEIRVVLQPTLQQNELNMRLLTLLRSQKQARERKTNRFSCV